MVASHRPPPPITHTHDHWVKDLQLIVCTSAIGQRQGCIPDEPLNRDSNKRWTVSMANTGKPLHPHMSSRARQLGGATPLSLEVACRCALLMKQLCLQPSVIVKGQCAVLTAVPTAVQPSRRDDVLCLQLCFQLRLQLLCGHRAGKMNSGSSQIFINTADNADLDWFGDQQVTSPNHLPTHPPHTHTHPQPPTPILTHTPPHQHTHTHTDTHPPTLTHPHSPTHRPLNTSGAAAGEPTPCLRQGGERHRGDQRA